jgi:hypothetical protein
MDRAARFAAAYAALMPAHDLADHVVQTDHQAANKAGSWSAMAGHVGSYTAVQLLAILGLRAVGVRPSWKRTAAAVTVSAGTHALLDRRWPVVEVLRRTGSEGFANPTIEVNGEALGDPNDYGSVTAHGRLPIHGPYVADQALHHAVLAVCAAILAGGR